MEVNNARFDGALKRFCDDLSEDPFFVKHQTFNSFDAKRMNDVRWCLTLVITMLSSYFNRDSEHEDYLERYNDDFPQHSDIGSRLQHVFSYMEDLDFDAFSRVWQKSDLFTCMVELDRARDLLDSLELSRVSAALHTFYQNVDRCPLQLAKCGTGCMTIIRAVLPSISRLPAPGQMTGLQGTPR